MVPSRLQNVMSLLHKIICTSLSQEKIIFTIWRISSHIPQVSDIPQFSNLSSTTIKALFKIILRMREPLAILLGRETFLIQSDQRTLKSEHPT